MNIKFIFGFLIFVSQNSMAQWVDQNAGCTYADMVKCADSIHCYLVGQEGNLRKTSDGIMWTAANYGIETGNFHHIAVIDKDTVYVAGSTQSGGACFFRSFNGGSSWNQISMMGYLSGLNFINSSLGYAINNNGAIMKTVDKGQNWIFVSNIAPSLFVRALYFLDENLGFAAACYYGTTTKNQIYKTTNAGQNWSLVYEVDITNQSQAYFMDIEMVSSQVGFACGGKCRIVRTVDGGETWTPLNNPYNNGQNTFWAVDFIDPWNGYVVGDVGIILKTKTGGNTWINQSGAYGAILDVEIAGTDIVYLASLSTPTAKIYKNSNANLSVTENEQFIGKIYPNPFSGYLNIEVELENTSLRIFDVLGNEMAEHSLVPAYNNSFDFSGFQNGVYLYQIFENGILINSGKIVKQ